MSLLRKVSVVTPVFGGGVRLNKKAPHQKDIDPVTPVRSASIRGQLRFWWRATHGCTSKTIAEMCEREAAIWGAASHKGKVALTVSGSVKPKDPFVYDDARRPLRDRQALAYAAFPLQPAGRNGTPGVLHVLGGEFQIELRVPNSLRDEVEDALDAWLLFGGIGGRTRRGFGCLGSQDIKEKDATKFLEKFGGSSLLEGVPSLRGAKFEIKDTRAGGAINVLAEGLGLLRMFRQGAGLGRNPGSSREHPGRSRWPEPDMIRAATRTAARSHAARLIHVDKAPRALFGMPVIVHFMGGGEPAETQLRPLDAQGKQLERMASPLILKPIQFGDRWKAGCLILSDPGRSKLRVGLVQGGNVIRTMDAVVTPDEQNRIEPLRDRSTNALDAFLKYFKEAQG